MSSYHFPSPHPKFGTKKNPLPEESWRDTAYYYWWEYLKRNEGYKKCCELGGCGPLSGLYADFGDVHTADFKSWWSEPSRAIHLFAEPKSDHKWGILDQPPSAEEISDDGVLFIKVPLNFPKRFLKQRFHEVLKEHHSGMRGKQYARISQAKYPLACLPNLHALKIMLAVYDLWLIQPKPLWKIAVQLHLCRR